MQLPKFSEKTNALVVSYITIRRAIGVSGFLLPVVLGLGGLLIGVPIQDNMSSYYHTPLRDVFVGTMCSIGIFLLCYRGHDWVESWTANAGCVAALAVALCPLDAVHLVLTTADRSMTMVAIEILAAVRKAGQCAALSATT